MIDVLSRKCIECGVIPHFNFVGQTKGLYCTTHKLDGMIDVTVKRCKANKCFNPVTTAGEEYCNKDLKSMRGDTRKMTKCQRRCGEDAVYGYLNKLPMYCEIHAKDDMIDLILENECEECENEHTHIYGNVKYCNDHLPSDSHLLTVKRICKYCDIREESEYICNDCKKVLHKKEWAVVRYLRKMIKTPFEYDTSKPLQGCSKRRPDIFFDLPSHCVIVEIDEDQHKGYLELCECSRMAEIVSGIGGRSVIFIRYNPDKVRSCGEIVDVTPAEKIDLLVKTIKRELRANYEEFTVKLVQIYYDDDWDDYAPLKEDDITHDVAI